MDAHGSEVKSIGVLVVHGIGDQGRGETLRKLLDGLRRASPATIPRQAHDGMRVELGGRTVRLYEVYWADLLRGEPVRGSFLIEEVLALVWFPIFNHVRKVYKRDTYSALTVLWWSLILPVMGWLILLAYQGGRLLAGVAQAAVEPFRGRRDRAERRVRESRITVADTMLDEYVGDVLNYVNSCAAAFYREPGESTPPEAVREAFHSISRRFYDQLVRAVRDDGCESIHVVAHSLGTVVMYHALRGFRFLGRDASDADAVRGACARVTHLYTIGSPLEKVRFFWPRIMPLRNLAGNRPIQWDNFVSYFDPVAGVLRRFNEWGRVVNHHLLGGGFIRGHVVYERSPVFLRSLTTGLLGKPLPMRRSWRERLGDLAILAGETLVAPGGLILVLAAGAGLLALAVLLLPFLVSLPFRLFSEPAVWGPILDWGALIVGVMFLIALSAAPLARASKAHRQYWTAPCPDGGETSEGARPSP